MRIPVVVIGAGHAGLAISHELSSHSVEHVVLERGEVANTWRTERWDSLTLLTPNWQTTLPGHAYDGDDPDGFMSMVEVIDFIDTYAELIDAPVETQTTVQSVRPIESGYEVLTNNGAWSCDAVVLATGGFNEPSVPAVASELPTAVVSLTPRRYRNADELPDGAVLVVGVSATGIQIAGEVQESGRELAISVGEHVRMPRVYRGHDIQWWMDRTGRLDERYDEVDDIVRARHTPSPQLVGRPDRSTLDLNTLTDRGARLFGRLSAITNGNAQFSGSLLNVCRLADLKLERLLNEFDEWATNQGLDPELSPPERHEPTRVEDEPPLSLDLETEIDTVIWATGFRPDYSWLDVPVLDRKGQIRHDGGVVSTSPGLYVTGLNFLRRRKSSFIHGAADDAADIVDHLVSHLESAETRGMARPTGTRARSH